MEVVIGFVEQNEELFNLESEYSNFQNFFIELNQHTLVKMKLISEI